jgi:hypothetical protein
LGGKVWKEVLGLFDCCYGAFFFLAICLPRFSFQMSCIPEMLGDFTSIVRMYSKVKLPVLKMDLIQRQRQLSGVGQPFSRSPASVCIS